MVRSGEREKKKKKRKKVCAANESREGLATGLAG
jgi:hypothetical protein